MSVEMGKVFGDDLDKLVDGIVSVVIEEDDDVGGYEGGDGLGGFQAILDMIKSQEEASGQQQ